MQKKKLLFVGDFAVTTGFARVNHNLLERLNQAEWEIHILGINTTGDPHPYQTRFPFVYPAALGGDLFGIGRIGPLVEAIQPDVVVFHQDAWNIDQYLRALEDHFAGRTFVRPRLVGWIPADAPNQSAAPRLAALDLVMCPTAFGTNELTRCGYPGRTAVVPYGVDRRLYAPMDRAEARRSLGFPDRVVNGFVVGRADRNAPRKRHDLTIKYFAEWWKDLGKPDDVFLYLHCAPRDQGFDLPQLVTYFGVDSQTIFTARDLHPGAAGSEERLRRILCSWDVHLSTTLGEGFGLVALDSMACAIPQALPRYSGYASWLSYSCGVMWAEIENIQAHSLINTLGGVVRGADVKDALTRLYRNPLLREHLGAAMLAVARSDRFNWDVIADQWTTEVSRVLSAE